MTNDTTKNQTTTLTDEEIAEKLSQIENNFNCVPNAYGEGIGFCAKSFDKDGKLITQEEEENTK